MVTRSVTWEDWTIEFSASTPEQLDLLFAHGVQQVPGNPLRWLIDGGDVHIVLDERRVLELMRAHVTYRILFHGKEVLRAEGHGKARCVQAPNIVALPQSHGPISYVF